jgi:hypothetical protein
MKPDTANRLHFPSAIAIALTLACGPRAVSTATPDVTPATSAEPFLPVETLVIEPDTALHKMELHIRKRGEMQYPMEARQAGIGAMAVVAYVVDTTGRIEPGTLRFVEPAPPRAFQEAICRWAPTTRFTTPRIDGQPRRVLRIQGFGFSTGRPPGEGPFLDPLLVSLRSLGPAAAVARLRPLPSCTGR